LNGCSVNLLSRDFERVSRQHCMLYIVECRFTDPARERAWNEWYSGRRIGELLAVPGFNTSQRFRSAVRPAVYLAVHSITSLDVFATAEYKAMGGGAFQGYQDCIADWHRTFYHGMERAPAVPLGDYLGLRSAVAERANDDDGSVWLKGDSRNPPEAPPRLRLEQAAAADFPQRAGHDEGTVRHWYVAVMSQRQGD